MLRHLVRIVLVAALGTALATAVLAVPAAAQPTITAQLGETATLVAKGAAIDVPIIHSCSPDTTFGSITVDVTERVGGGHLARGRGGTSGVTCDGTEHTAVVRITASGDIAFKKGDAVAEGHFFACNPFRCTEILFSGTIRIH